MLALTDKFSPTNKTLNTFRVISSLFQILQRKWILAKVGCASKIYQHTSFLDTKFSLVSFRSYLHVRHVSITTQKVRR